MRPSSFVLLMLFPSSVLLHLAKAQEKDYDFLYNEVTGTACLDLMEAVLPAPPSSDTSNGLTFISSPGITIDLLEDVTGDECRSNCTLKGIECLGFEYRASSDDTDPVLGTCETWDLLPASMEPAMTIAISTCAEKLFVEYPGSACYSPSTMTIGSEGTDYLVDVMNDPTNITECAEACLLMDTVVDEDGNTVIVPPPSTPPLQGSSEQPNPYCYAFQSILGRCLKYTVPTVPSPTFTTSDLRQLSGATCFIRPVRPVEALNSAFDVDTTEPSEGPTLSPSESTEEPTTSPTGQDDTSSPTDQTATARPTQQPTNPPTRQPALSPNFEPTIPPTKLPTSAPSFEPTSPPTKLPTSAPSFEPTSPPTKPPTFAPSFEPTPAPTFARPKNPSCSRLVDLTIEVDDDGFGEGDGTAQILTDGSTDGGCLNSGKETDTYVYFRIKLDCSVCRERKEFPIFSMSVVSVPNDVDDWNFFAGSCNCNGFGKDLFTEDSLGFSGETLDDYGLIVSTKQLSGELKVTVEFTVQQVNFFPTEAPTDQPTVAPFDDPTESPSTSPTASPTTTPPVPDECRVCPTSDDEICNDEFVLTNGLTCAEFEASLAKDNDAGVCTNRKDSATSGDSCGRSVEEVCGCASSCPYQGPGAQCDI